MFCRANKHPRHWFSILTFRAFQRLLVDLSTTNNETFGYVLPGRDGTQSFIQLREGFVKLLPEQNICHEAKDQKNAPTEEQQRTSSGS
jgi:hypothetical protein